MKWLSKLVDNASELFRASQRTVASAWHCDGRHQFYFAPARGPQFFHAQQFLFAPGCYHRHPRLVAGEGVIARHCEEGAFPDEAIPLFSIASRLSQCHSLSMTESFNHSTLCNFPHLPPTTSATGISTHRGRPT